MTVKCSVFIATSVDGFIARPDGDIGWLGEPDENEEDHGYERFMASVDHLVMGRNTFEKVLSFGIPWPYDKPVVVLSSKPLQIDEGLRKSVEQMAGSPQEILGQLAKRGAQHVYLDGGDTIQRFLRAGLVQRLIMTRIPVLLGEGLPLFGTLPQDVRLRHVETQTFSRGLVQTEYEIAHD